MKYITESLAQALYDRRVNESKEGSLEDVLMSKFKDLSPADKKRLTECSPVDEMTKGDIIKSNKAC